MLFVMEVVGGEVGKKELKRLVPVETTKGLGRKMLNFRKHQHFSQQVC